jgi:hypothetical protein
VRQTGVNTNAPTKVKARAIVAQEQQILANERVRVASAVEKLMQRRDAAAHADDLRPLPETEKPMVSKGKSEKPASTQTTEKSTAPDIESSSPLVKEAQEIEKQALAAEAEAQRKLDRVLDQLSAEDAAKLKTELTGIRRQAGDYAKVVESAFQCILKP